MDVSDFLAIHWARLPLLLVYVAGVWLSLSRWRRHAFVSAFALAGFGLATIILLAGLYFSYWQINAMDAGVSPRDVGFYSGVFMTVSGIATTVAVALIVQAVFGWRHTGPVSSRPDAQMGKEPS